MVRYDPMRVVVVTAGMSVAGAAAGAVASAATVAVAIVAHGGHFLFEQAVFGLAVRLGVALGAVLAPAATWLLLRRVPVGRAFLGVSAGAVVGAIAGYVLPTVTDPFLQPLCTGAIGFVAAGAWLRLRSRSPAGRPPAGAVGADSVV